MGGAILVNSFPPRVLSWSDQNGPQRSKRRSRFFVARDHPARYAKRMSAVPIKLEKEDPLAQRMAALGVSEADLEETFVRSGGHGGQNVNKTSTCVMLVHRPTGVQVKCQETRQQGLNRIAARRLLLDKIAALRKHDADAERARLEKLRRQKRKRSQGAKNRMLADKSRRAAKKGSRRRVDLD